MNKQDTPNPTNPTNPTEDIRKSLKPEDIPNLPFNPLPNSLTGAGICNLTTSNGFGIAVKTNPDLTNQYKVDLYTVYPVGINAKGKPEILADYEPFEYITASAVIVILLQFGELDKLDPVEEDYLFISHTDNTTASDLPWYDLAGKLSIYLAGVVTGFNIFIDKLGKGKGDDDDQW